MNLYEFFKRMLSNPLNESNALIPLTISDGTNTVEVVVYARDLDRVLVGNAVHFEGMIYPKSEIMEQRERKCV